VVAIARDTHATDFAASVSKRVYLPLPDDRATSDPILVRTSNIAAANIIRLLDPLLASVDPNIVASCASLDDLLRQTASFMVAILASLVASAVGLLGLVLAIMGIYGTVSYLVILRTRELGIRMAIGAQARDVIWTILREIARPPAGRVGGRECAGRRSGASGARAAVRNRWSRRAVAGAGGADAAGHWTTRRVSAGAPRHKSGSLSRAASLVKVSVYFG
jgi:hypothetical protein